MLLIWLNCVAFYIVTIFAQPIFEEKKLQTRYGWSLLRQQS